MEALSQWVKNLVFIILFTTLLEMFLPENNLRKYVRVVMGFFIISIFISPLAAIFSNDLKITDNILTETNLTNWSQIKQQGERINQVNGAMIKGYYENKTAERVKEVLKVDYPEYDFQVEIGIDDQYKINQLVITVQPENKVEKVEIKPVEINRKANDSQPVDENLSVIQMKIKQKLSQFFQVPIQFIKVKIADRRE